MTDRYEELRAAAEKVSAGPFSNTIGAKQEFAALANPTTILALLEERERMVGALKSVSLARKIVEPVKAAPGAHSMIMSDGSVVTGEPANVVMALVTSIRTICDVADAALTAKEG